MSRKRILPALILFLFALTQFAPGLAFPSAEVSAAACDLGQFIADVTVPDGTTYDAGASFTKIWRFKNVGSCTWTTAYKAVFYTGPQLGSIASVYFPTNVAPGGTVDISVEMVAPLTPGHYRSYWRLQNASGAWIGLSSNIITFFVDINVTSSATSSPGYDFAANSCTAVWESGAGVLPCPGSEGDTRGAITTIDTPTLENGNLNPRPGLLVNPQSLSGGYIQGTYPAILIQAGDHFQSIISCAYGAQGCYVNFRLAYQIGSGLVTTFWNFFERNEGLYYQADLDLSPLAGQQVKFILYVSDVSGRGVPSDDQALWVEPRILRLSGGSISPVQASATDTPQVIGTNTPTPTLTLTSIAQPLIDPTETTQAQPTDIPSSCNRAIFVADVTIPDGTQLAAGASFTKTWRIKNTSTCTWTTSYTAVFYSGTPMTTNTEVNLPSDVPPGGTVDITVNMVAPTTTGHYRSHWMLRNSSGTVFGLGAYGLYTFFADIYSVAAVTSTLTPTLTGASPTGTPSGPTSTPENEPATPTFIPTVVPPTNTPVSSSCSLIYNGAFEQEVLDLINEERANYGLAPLTVSYALEISSGNHSVDMVSNDFMSHTGSDGSSYWDREVRAGYTGRWGGEILASSRTHDTPQEAVDWWMNDPPHRAIILADYQDFGAGYAYCSTSLYGGFITVDFGHR